MAYELRKTPEIMSAIDFYHGGPSLQEQIAGVLKTIRNAPPYAQPEAQRLLAELTGLIAPSKFKAKPANSLDDEPEAKPVIDGGTFDASPTKFYVGQLVNQRDEAGTLHTGRVTALDPEGNPHTIIDETGNRYGRLAVLRFVSVTDAAKAIFLCRCECGKLTEVTGGELRTKIRSVADVIAATWRAKEITSTAKWIIIVSVIW
jgi:hypothetical protein